MTAIWDLPLSSSSEYIKHAIDSEQQEIAFDLWKSVYPDMMNNKLEFMSLNDFREKLFSQKQEYSDKSADEIEKELSLVIAAFEKGGA